MEEVRKLTTKWIQECLRALLKSTTGSHPELSADMIEKSKSHVRAFGSFELNVHFGDSDIDLLCIGPKFVTRDMLFKEFVEMLEADDRVDHILVQLYIISVHFVPLSLCRCIHPFSKSHHPQKGDDS